MHYLVNNYNYLSKMLLEQFKLFTKPFKLICTPTGVKITTFSLKILLGWHRIQRVSTTKCMFFLLISNHNYKMYLKRCIPLISTFLFLLFYVCLIL